MKRQNLKFKETKEDQAFLIPPSLDDMIDKNHPVRIVKKVLDSIDVDVLLEKYKGGGTSSYHPRMLLKVLVYSHLNNVYSSRRIEAALKENIHFMWISGMSTPDHNTINRFRSQRLKGVLKQVFGKVVELLAEEGLVDLREIYIDGTKIEANANKYTFTDKACNLLHSEKGISYRKKRSIEPEPVFGNIKQNKGYKRFLLRGKDKVEIEVGLLSIAHNLKKWSC